MPSTNPEPSTPPFPHTLQTFPCPLLDLRPTSDHTASHPLHATHFNCLTPPDGLLNRLHELPPTKSSLLYLITATSADFTQATQILTKKGFLPPVLLPASVYEALPSSSGLSTKWLWQPAPLLQRHLPHLESLIPSKTALDIGAGCGRDSAYLASRGFTVTAVERDAVLVRKAHELGVRCAAHGGHVHAVARTFGRDLNADRRWLQEHRAALMVVVRFLRRGVLELLHEGVVEGGVVVYEHFLRGCEKFAGPKKESQMLEMGELGLVFSARRGFVVLSDAKETLADGRPIVRFVAQRRVP